mgnify:CR=1 FL=1
MSDWDNVTLTAAEYKNLAKAVETAHENGDNEDRDNAVRLAKMIGINLFY